MIREVTQDFLREWYEGEAHRNDQLVMYRTAWAQQRRDTIVNLFTESVSPYNKTVLDVGCGRGWYTIECVKMGVESATGFDIAPTNIKNAFQDAHEILGTESHRAVFGCRSWDTWEPRHGPHYDIVLATEVFEHAINPDCLAQKCMNAGNIVIASAPISELSVPSEPFKIQGHLHVFTELSFHCLWGRILHAERDDHYAYVVAEGRKDVSIQEEE